MAPRATPLVAADHLAPAEGMMTDPTRVLRRPRRAWPRPPRTVAAIIAAATLALLAAACGSGDSPSPAGSGGSPAAGGSAGSPSAVAYSACMRSHGVPTYPDPNSSGQLPKTDAQLLGVSTSQYQAAQHACQHLLPTGGSIQQQEAHACRTATARRPWCSR